MFFILFLLLGTSNGLLNSKPNNNINRNNIIKLAETNFKLVPYFAKSYIYKHKLNTFEKQELIQEGYIGFMKACAKYNESKGLKISTYSSFWIRRYMTNYINKMYKRNNMIIYSDTFLKTTKVTNNNNFDFEDFISMYQLNSLEKDIIYRRYILKQTVKNIAKDYGYSRNTITNYCNKIKIKIKNNHFNN